MALSSKVDDLIAGLPDADSARRFLSDLMASYPRTDKISEALLSDLLTLSSYSPLLAVTVLQNHDYIAWLERERIDTSVRSKEVLLESLSRFELLHSGVSPNVMLARFRRRELLRIYLRDIRRLAAIAEITEELSNLADAIIEFSLRLARQDLENRFGKPLESDGRGRLVSADFCVIALGKLGSRELNYSSDIDLLFVYSSEGSTSDAGSSESVTNREFFIKLAERVISLAGGQSGEGGAYRIDMRLRPHGSIGRLALSLDETVRYYATEAREWEQQVLIRSRPTAGDQTIYRRFYAQVEDFIYRSDIDPAVTLANVSRSKRRLEDPTGPGAGFNVKLGRGGIREIEFIAQALQLAYGGSDRWLRWPHTLVSLARLADRQLIGEKELASLFEAYVFLRHVEHLLQMEHGLQTHSVPRSETARTVLAKRAGFANFTAFEAELETHSKNVLRVFDRVFGEVPTTGDLVAGPGSDDRADITADGNAGGLYAEIARVSPHFAQLAASMPGPALSLERFLTVPKTDFVLAQPDLGSRLSVLRRSWSRSLLGIVYTEVTSDMSIAESKSHQTRLAESSVEIALAIMRDEIYRKFGIPDLELSVLALGKLGGRGVDYGSDLDVVLVYPDRDDFGNLSPREVYGRAVEIFVTALSGITRDGNLYRVDLRLRPFGKNGASSNPRSVFVDYFRHTAVVWELLAFVKLRGVAGPQATEVEHEVRDVIHRRALEAGAEKLRGETLRVRYLLEEQKGTRGGVPDIKYTAGGMLDVYFAARYLQLRYNVPDRADERSTMAVLGMLWERGVLSEPDHEAFTAGYSFLSELDHNIRLATGRSRRMPSSPDIQDIIARRMSLADRSALAETLAIHQMNIRKAFENVLYNHE